MADTCARCGKRVYPVEKLELLSQIWHKWCFRCDTCNLKLTMKTYQAVDGKPYCRAHYPMPGRDTGAPVPTAGSSYGTSDSGKIQGAGDEEGGEDEGGDYEEEGGGEEGGEEEYEYEEEGGGEEEEYEYEEE